MVEVFTYWLASSIEFDQLYAYGGTSQDQNWQKVLSSKKAIPLGYCNLFQAMCENVGIQNYIIFGYTKDRDFKNGTTFVRTNHLWNIVLLEQEQFLFDIPWSVGLFDAGRNNSGTFVKEFQPAKLFVNPALFILDHLPAQPRWQLLKNPVTITDFSAENLTVAMVSSKQETNPHYHYQDSINQFLALSIKDRELKDAFDAHNFNPQGANLAWFYQQKAFDISAGEYDEVQLKIAISYYQKAIKIYSRFNSYEALRMIDSCERGIRNIKIWLGE